MTQSPHPFWVRGLPNCKCVSSRERNANLWRRHSGGPVGAGRGEADRCGEPPRRGPPQGAAARVPHRGGERGSRVELSSTIPTAARERRASRSSMASVSTAPRAPLPAMASSTSSAWQVDPNPSGSRFFAGRRLRVVRRLAGAAPSRRAPLVCCSAHSSDVDAGDERGGDEWG